MMRNIYKTLILGSLLALSAADTIAQQTTNDTTKVYGLGEVEVVSERVNQTVFRQQSMEQNRTDVSEALSSLPSVSYVYAGSRGESMIYLRGFDTRGIPLFIDGIPVYVSYDGTMDLASFKTFGYSKIVLSQGMSAMSYGPNALGGVINLVSLKPQKKLEIEALGGFSSGNGNRFGMSAGSKWGKFYLQADYYRSEQDYISLSGKFISRPLEDGKKLENSHSKDQNMRLKIGFIPNKNHEYSLGFSHQTREKGNPAYSGNDSLQLARFWKWPVWNKTGLYALGKSRLNKSLSLKTTAYMDYFDNKLESYDDSTYSSQTRKYAFTSFYRDHSAGGNTNLQADLGEQNTLNTSVHYKYDQHNEHNEGEKNRMTDDQTLSIGMDDAHRFNDSWVLLSGISWHLRQGLHAQEYFASADSVGNLATKNDDALNAQLGLQYFLKKWAVFKGSVAHKTRFATMKERYSYKNGRGLPNPGLESERATLYELEARLFLPYNLQMTTSAFYTHISNAIQLVEEVEPGKSQMQNTGQSEFKGADISLSYEWKSLLKAGVSYGYIIQKNLSRPEILYTDVPENKWRGEIVVKPFKFAKIIGSALYFGERNSTSYGFKANAFATFDLSAAAEWKGFELSGGVQNLSDVYYEYTEGFPAAGRNYFVNLVYSFESAK